MAQTGRRAWAIGIAGVLAALALTGFLMGLNRPPPVAETRQSFMEGSVSQCPAQAEAKRCSALCDCVWDGILAAHAGDRAVAEFLKSAIKDRTELEALTNELANDCAARLPAQ